MLTVAQMAEHEADYLAYHGGYEHDRQVLEKEIHDRVDLDYSRVSLADGLPIRRYVTTGLVWRIKDWAERNSPDLLPAAEALAASVEYDSTQERHFACIGKDLIRKLRHFRAARVVVCLSKSDDRMFRKLTSGRC